jgi:hypothetical protein
VSNPTKPDGRIVRELSLETADSISAAKKEILELLTALTAVSAVAWVSDPVKVGQALHRFTIAQTQAITKSLTELDKALATTTKITTITQLAAVRGPYDQDGDE